MFDPDGLSLEIESRRDKTFVFDNIFDENDNNLCLYTRSLTPIVSNLMSGFNSTIFAYGMTGAGKSYTMFGDFLNPDNFEKEPGKILKIECFNILFFYMYTIYLL